ncbi:EAL domain-containing protein [Sulfurimonas sp. HSL-1716]|uniref:sensor domain-containing diguanylate cyclase n=1 Tax=Hydrocurvibacter sulfurireducens TaxID=3131937 RepID=UPI0031F97E9B
MANDSCTNLELETLREVSITEKEFNSILNLQSVVLEMVAGGESSLNILNRLCDLAEALLPNSVASIMLIDSETGFLNVLAAPSVPESGHQALSNLRPGKGSGSCGNAVFSNKPTFIKDTFSDPRWHDIRSIAYDFNLRSCWSMPVRDEEKNPIATFALSSFEHRMPSSFHKKLLETGANIVNIVLKNENQKKIIVEKEKRINLFSTALQNTSEGFYITDKDNNILEINDSFTKIMGYTKEDVIGKNPRIFSSNKHDRKYFQKMWNSIIHDKHYAGEVINKKKNGEFITQWISINSIEDENNEIQNYVAIFTDISKLKASEEKIEYLAYHDLLTSCYNKVFLAEKMEAEESENCSLILLNVDNFSYVNLSYGFDIGDKLLVGISNELKEICKESEIFRINSDEFALLCHTQSDAKANIEKIRNHFNKVSFYIDNININVSFSYGASGNGNCSLQNSALALKQAKEGGKNRYYIFSKDDNSIDVNKRENFVKYNNILHEAIEFGYMVPYFQGIRDNRTGEIVKYESLVRIVKDDEIITPFQFLQTAKLSGMLPDITKVMIDKSFAIMASNDYTFSINITEDDLDSDYLEEYLHIKSKEYGIAPNRITLEILEGMSSTGKRDHIRQLNALKREGYLLAIDDFGAEYSNFERVLDLDIDFLKIDARYIKNIDIDNKSYEITKSIVYFAKNAGIPCIAEFVHNDDVQNIVEKLGIEYSQGFLFSEPSEYI